MHGLWNWQLAQTMFFQFGNSLKWFLIPNDGHSGAASPLAASMTSMPTHGKNFPSG